MFVCKNNVSQYHRWKTYLITSIRNIVTFIKQTHFYLDYNVDIWFLPVLTLTHPVFLQHFVNFAFMLYLIFPPLMALNSLIYADMPLRNYSLTPHNLCPRSIWERHWRQVRGMRPHACRVAMPTDEKPDREMMENGQVNSWLVSGGADNDRRPSSKMIARHRLFLAATSLPFWGAATVVKLGRRGGMCVLFFCRAPLC